MECLLKSGVIDVIHLGGFGSIFFRSWYFLFHILLIKGTGVGVYISVLV